MVKFKFEGMDKNYFKEDNSPKVEKEVLVEVDTVSYPEDDYSGGGIITTKAWVYKKNNE